MQRHFRESGSNPSQYPTAPLTQGRTLRRGSNLKLISRVASQSGTGCHKFSPHSGGGRFSGAGMVWLVWFGWLGLVGKAWLAEVQLVGLV